MEDKPLLGTFNYHLESGERKYPNAHKDVKRKLSFINKKIGDLQRQRRFAYKNSAKVKKIVHYQVNQIVKSLRARERNLWADVDEAYLSHDENISNELSRLQSVHARCQALFDHLDYNKGDIDILNKINSILSEVSFGEKPNAKALEFISDFESMRSMANCFGHLDGDFIKKDGFVVLDKNDNSSDLVCEKLNDKTKCLEKIAPLAITGTENTKNNFCKESESEDSFEIVDLLENMCCEEFDKDSAMVEQDTFLGCSQQAENVDYLLGNGHKLLKVPIRLGNSQRALKSNDFNPEEEWKQIFEMRSKIAELCDMTSKLSDENKNCEKQNKCLSLKETDNWLHDRNSSEDNFYNKNCKQDAFLKEYDNWLQKRSLENDALQKERNFERINIGINFSSSPAEVIRQAFTSYLTKEGNENWLLCD